MSLFILTYLILFIVNVVIVDYNHNRFSRQKIMLTYECFIVLGLIFPVLPGVLQYLGFLKDEIRYNNWKNWNDKLSLKLDI
jgi:hypothetical protein